MPMSNKLKSYDKRKLITSFIFKAILFFVAWQILFAFWIKTESGLNEVLTDYVIKATKIGMESLGFSAKNDGNIILIENKPILRVENECNGLELLALFAGFIICFPGHPKIKLLYILIGSVILLMVNVGREILLGLNYYYFRSTFDINHKYTYTIIVYLIVFGIWKHWLKNYSLVSNKKN